MVYKASMGSLSYLGYGRSGIEQVTLENMPKGEIKEG